MVENTSPLDNDTALDLLARLLEVPSAPSPDQFLEICLLQALPKEVEAKEPVKVTDNIKVEVTPKPPTVQETAKKEAAASKPASKPNPKAETSPVATKKIDKSAWTEVLDLLKVRYNTLYGVVRMADVDFGGPNVIKLKFAYPFHQNRVNDPKNKQIIQQAVAQVSGRDVAIECIVDASLLSKTNEPAPELETINTIFGGGELLG